MKTDPKNNKMVSRNESPKNTFIVTKASTSDADVLAKEVAEEELELAGVLEGIQMRQAQIADKKRLAAEAEAKEKLETRAGLLDDAADWREIARTSSDPHRAVEFLRKAKDAEAEAARIAQELNLNEPAASGKLAQLKQTMSTTKAIRWILFLFVCGVILTMLVAHFIPDDPTNSMGQTMLKNAPLRVLIAFTLTFLSFLVGVFFLLIAFNPFYRIWHNRIDSERTLETLISEAPAWAVLGCLFGILYTFMQLFASFYQALYA